MTVFGLLGVLSDYLSLQYYDIERTLCMLLCIRVVRDYLYYLAL